MIFGTIYDEKLKKGELKVTVIATSFSSDISRKNLFSSTPTFLKEENADLAKKEIRSTIESNAGKKKEVPEIIIEDDTEEWSAVPAFLRRKKEK